MINDVNFTTNPLAASYSMEKTLKQQCKNEGSYVKDLDPEEDNTAKQDYLRILKWTQVGFDPRRGLVLLCKADGINL